MDTAEVHRKEALLCNKKDSGNFWKEIRENCYRCYIQKADMGVLKNISSIFCILSASF